MAIIPPLPTRTVNQSLRLTKFSEFIGKTDEEIKNNIFSGIYIDDFELLKNNFDLFQRIVDSKKIDSFYSKEYECLVYIEENLKDYSNIRLSLIDDFENRDRRIIQPIRFEKTQLEIPFSYLMWGIDIKDRQKISLYNSLNQETAWNSNGFDYVTVEELKMVKELIDKLGQKYQGLSDMEKAILISNYIQDNIQYVDTDNISRSSSGIYITDSKGIIVSRERVGNPFNAIFNKFGKCNAIAHATTILLNNPQLSVNMRSLFGEGHVWNVVEIDGKRYFVDNTWCITRNPDRYPQSLKAKSFSDEYLFFGTNTASRIGHHTPETFCKKVSIEDFSREELLQIKQGLLNYETFTKYYKPIFKSKIKRNT